MDMQQNLMNELIKILKEFQKLDHFLGHSEEEKIFKRKFYNNKLKKNFNYSFNNKKLIYKILFKIEN